MLLCPFQSLDCWGKLFWRTSSTWLPFYVCKNIFMSNTARNDDTMFGIYGESLYDLGYLMTPSEEIFFKRLCEYVQDKDYIVCPKVRLWDIITIEKRRWHHIWSFIGRPWQVTWKLDRSHIDFVLIGKKKA
jgi:hypothetical protein